MGFEGADDTFSSVALVEIMWNKLLITFTFLRDYKVVLLDGFVVEYLELDRGATLLEAYHDALVGRNAVAIVLGLEGLD